MKTSIFFTLVISIFFFIAIFLIHIYMYGIKEISNLGAYLTGVAAFLGIILGIPQLVDLKNKKLSLEKKEEIISSLVQLRTFVDRIYEISLPFPYQSDPKQEEGEKYPEYLIKVRGKRINDVKVDFDEFRKNFAKIDLYLPKEAIELSEKKFKCW